MFPTTHVDPLYVFRLNTNWMEKSRIHWIELCENMEAIIANGKTTSTQCNVYIILYIFNESILVLINTTANSTFNF